MLGIALLCRLAVLAILLTLAMSQCIFGNRTYKHGEKFQDCKSICTCRYQSVACVSACPPSIAVPTDDCPNPVQRIPDNKCCAEHYCDPCSAGRFGLACTKTCGQCTSGRCNITTGACEPLAENGHSNPLCLPGYFGDTCMESCPEGKYGYDCYYSCGKCAGAPTECDVITGVCLKTSPKCKPGWMGKKCHSRCQKGTYGADCIEKCGACAAGNCDRNNGTCDADVPLCKAGYYGRLCKDACPPGTFGTLCRWDCGGCTAGEKTCNPQTGECPEAEPRCKPGYMGEMCKACGAGTWGENCQYNCSVNCARGELECDRRDGTCLGGCVSGYYGDRCEPRNESASNLSTVVGVAVGMGALVLVAIMMGTLIYLYCNRRRQALSSKEEIRRNDSYLTPVIGPPVENPSDLEAMYREGTYEMPVTTSDPFFYTPFGEEDTMLYEMMLPRTNWQANMDDLEMSSTTMIQGNFGQTTLTNWHHNVDRSLATPVGVKRFPGNGSDENKNLINLEREKLRSLERCVNVLAVLGASIDRNNGDSLLLLEWTEKDNLFKYLRALRSATGNGGNQRVINLVRMCRGVANGMVHISPQITNIDLSSETILLDQYMNPKITGLVHFEDSYEDVQRQRESARWSALETLVSGGHTPFSDVWRFGVLIWEIFSLGETPYAEVNLKDLQEKLETGYRLSHPDEAPTIAYVTMTQCWNATPVLRPSFRKLASRLLQIKQDHQLQREMTYQRDSGTYCNVY